MGIQLVGVRDQIAAGRFFNLARLVDQDREQVFGHSRL